jgi:cytochrome d ubiquinol oxidase subunit II
MTAADLLCVVLLLALTAYGLFGGADFGAGVWDLVAGGAERGAPQRKLIEHAIGPVWEANHVWLIFTTVLLWTGFPAVFASVASTMYIPLTAAALGIIGRGAGFAFRKTSVGLAHQRLYGAGFAFSSVVTPFFMGTVLGGVATGRVPLGIAGGDIWTAWLNPTSVATGALAVAICAYLAAVFLVRDAQRHAPRLVPMLRRRAMSTGVAVGVLAVAALPVVDLPLNTPLVVVSLASGLASLILLYVKQFVLVRLTAGLAVAAVLWAWAAGQYPYLLPGSATVHGSAATASVLHATLGAVAVGTVILAPSLWWLLKLSQSEPGARPEVEDRARGT